MSAVHLDACRFRMESSYVRIKQTFSDYAADCFAQGRPLLLAAEDLMHKIHRDFSYAPGATSPSAPRCRRRSRRAAVSARISPTSCCPACALWIWRPATSAAICGPRRSRLPMLPCWARMHRTPGFRLFCPPYGWVDFDPTNDVRVGTDHIVIAWGRDFGDVSPLRGVIVGGGAASFIGSRFGAGRVRSKSQNLETYLENSLGQAELSSREEAEGGRQKGGQDAKQQRRSQCRGQPTPPAPDAADLPVEPAPAKSVR